MYADELTVTLIGVLQGLCDVELIPPSERVATARSEYDRCSTCDGVRVDDEWQYQRVCKGGSRCRPVRTGKFSVRSPTVSVLAHDCPTSIAERCR